jgi:tRNA A58 N-methylase Trm61
VEDGYCGVLGNTNVSTYTLGNDEDEGAQRLKALEAFSDVVTLRKLERVSIQPGWKCLEIGAGSGSIVRHLSQAVGSTGQILATDIDTRFLDALAQDFENVAVRVHDITKDELPASAFDLIHARHVFVHLPSAVETAHRIVKCLKPGGWLLIEEFDPAVDRTFPIVDRLIAAAFDRVASTG